MMQVVKSSIAMVLTYFAPDFLVSAAEESIYWTNDEKGPDRACMFFYSHVIFFV